jgi:hypothetical protein
VTGVEVPERSSKATFAILHVSLVSGGRPDLNARPKLKNVDREVAA